VGSWYAGWVPCSSSVLNGVSCRTGDRGTDLQIERTPRRLCQLASHALISYLHKLFEKAISVFVVGAGFHRLQGGFQPNRSTLDQIAALDHLLHATAKKKQKSYMVFLDSRAANDKVDRNVLYSKARSRGVPERIICMLSAMIRNGRATVAAYGVRSR
jgi:hypothetical protein